MHVNIAKENCNLSKLLFHNVFLHFQINNILFKLIYSEN